MRAGWDIYRSAGGEIGLDDLNAQLVRARYMPLEETTSSLFRRMKGGS
jgi:hypothetical protein